MFTDRPLDTPAQVRARWERMDRLEAELRASVERRLAIVNKWRREGLLPPEEQRRRV
jgi:hypothetical protein